MPYQICVVCEKRLRKYRAYRESLIKNEAWFLSQIQEEHPAESPKMEEILFVSLKEEPKADKATENTGQKDISDVKINLSNNFLVAEELEENNWLIEVKDEYLKHRTSVNDFSKPRPSTDDFTNLLPSTKNYPKTHPATDIISKSRSRRKDCLINCRVEGCGSVLKTKDNYKTHLRAVHRSLPNLKKFLGEATKMKPDFYRSAEECQFDQ